ncbi:hypothetical protein H1R20_g5328, partial [Candolleomyces eurysporus]
MPGRPPTQSLLKSVSSTATKTASKAAARPQAVRHFTRSATRSTLANPVRFIASTSTPSTDNKSAVDFAWKTQFSGLEDALSGNATPSRVWNSYVDLLDVFGYQTLPVEVHQQVLRKCSPSPQQLRISAARRIIAGNEPRVPHIHESKFQTIIRNIRASGHVPSLEDYHFILTQFAAVGNYPGSIQVYEEVKSAGHTPTAKTVGLVLQAIVHRLTLPIMQHARPRMIEQTRKIFNDLLSDMRELKIPMVAANMDLSFRVLKESLDYEAFESLMKWAYGIDLAYPDKVPLQLLERKYKASLSGTGLDSTSGQVPVPFSTSALNTTIDFLGRMGNVSKMIQAFEVLTQPLPHAQEHFFSSFEDDEDDVGAILQGPRPSFTPPHAEPNTTTYATLIRHISRAGNRMLARHYLNESMWLDRETVMNLRHGTWQKADADIPRPKFALNRNLLLPVLGLANRDKNMGLLRWLSTKLPRILRRKKADLDYHISRRNYRARRFPSDTPSDVKSAAEEKRRLDSIFDLDFDTTIPLPKKTKPFNAELHIQILEKDLRDLEDFRKRVEFVLGRTSQRVKERLGRRVWENKDVWVSTARRRTQLSREQWREIVNFKPMKKGLRKVARYYSTASSSQSQPLGVSVMMLSRAPRPLLAARRRPFSTSFVGSHDSPSPPGFPEVLTSS